MTEQPVSGRSRFEREVLPHLDAAYNLARWLTRDPNDAEDVVQDACVRALRYVGTLRGGGAKAWLLTIVRNAFYDWVSRNRPVEIVHDAGDALDEAVDVDAVDPERAAIRRSDARVLSDALATLPLQFREAVVLRELEDLSYRDMARVIGVPIGTVMSRLARGRALLRQMPSLQQVNNSLDSRRQS
jgi:RNA polymerase sigma-70 factor (ECF subfamily)